MILDYVPVKKAIEEVSAKLVVERLGF